MFSFTLANKKSLPQCPFGATCYRKNLLHFAEFSHPFDLLNPDADSSDEEEATESTKTKKQTGIGNKRKRESDDEYDGEKTEEYNSDDVSRCTIDNCFIQAVYI